MEDGEIIRLFWERSQEAINELDRKYGALIRRISGNILADSRDVEEAVADTYMKLWSSIPPQRPRTLAAYAIRLGRNSALDALRTQRRQKRGGNAALCLEELDQCIPSGHRVDEELEAGLMTELINRYLATLDKSTRQIFLRRYFSMDAAETIARDFGLTKNAVSTRLARARKGLRAYLEKEGFAI